MVARGDEVGGLRCARRSWDWDAGEARWGTTQRHAGSTEKKKDFYGPINCYLLFLRSSLISHPRNREVPLRTRNAWMAHDSGSGFASKEASGRS